ncbi:hypothetical protein MMC28_005166 [Mycoblastus sanguinarius]|nr:hypothetical protein [Mycoblastus sanguinarius]
MVHSLRPIAGLVLLLAIHSTVAANPAQAAVGKVPGFLGFIGGSPDHYQDYLTSYFCFCKNERDEGHYFQFEYYNVHCNATFILEHLCSTPKDADTTCFPTRQADKATTGAPYVWASGQICRTWRNGRKSKSWHKTHDQLCYEPHARTWYATDPGDDHIFFNKRKRNLSDQGGQGWAEKSAEEIEPVCEQMCQENLAMSVVTDLRFAPSQIYIYEELDNMCYKCK